MMYSFPEGYKHHEGTHLCLSCPQPYPHHPEYFLPHHMCLRNDFDELIDHSKLYSSKL